MKKFFQNALKSFTYSLFNEKEFKCLERDLERRFKKLTQNESKFKYIKQNIQYKTLVYYRLSVACRIPVLKKILDLLYRRHSQKTGIEFFSPILGGGVILPHWGRIILNAESIGENFYVFHNVTIGNDYISGKPKIGNNVFIGTNTVVLGDITIGNNVVIGACSFVNTNIPSNSIAVGNPARVIKTIDDDYITRMLGY